MKEYGSIDVLVSNAATNPIIGVPILEVSRLIVSLFTRATQVLNMNQGWCQDLPDGGDKVPRQGGYKTR